MMQEEGKTNTAIRDWSETKKLTILAGSSLIENRSQEHGGKGVDKKKKKPTIRMMNLEIFISKTVGVWQAAKVLI